ncbi:hypothetical protein [Maritalea sp.]|uniref:hypothetical protein n=1 Tax=Maritalea sp. TaxID=2003361 RepID=UPI003F4A8736
MNPVIEEISRQTIGTRIAVTAILVGLLMTVAVKSPKLLFTPRVDVVRVWFDCATENWPVDLQPIMVVRRINGTWEHRVRFKPYDQDAQFLLAPCRFEKVEASQPFTTPQWPSATPRHLEGVNDFYRLDRLQLSDEQRNDIERTATQLDGLELVFDGGNDMSVRVGIGARQITLTSLFTVSDENDDVLLRPGFAPPTGGVFMPIPIVIESDEALQTSATSLGQGIVTQGGVPLRVYQEAAGSELTITRLSYQWLVFAIEILAPIILGFGVGILAGRLKTLAGEN